MQLETVLDNLKDILSQELGENKVYDKDVAYALGLSKESLSHHKRKQTIPYEAIVYFCAKRHISINWVLFNQLPKSLEAHTEPFVAIKYFKELTTSAGGGGVGEVTHPHFLYLSRQLIKTFYKTSPPFGCLHALHVKGDSMEPTLEDGALMLVDSSKTHIQKGGIFVLEHEAGLLVKRLLSRCDGGVEIASDNPHYSPYILCAQELATLRIHGEVLGCIGV